MGCCGGYPFFPVFPIALPVIPFYPFAWGGGCCGGGRVW